jgi:dolichyl-phosphate-mannose-protein mannosyltransferase
MTQRITMTAFSTRTADPTRTGRSRQLRYPIGLLLLWLFALGLRFWGLERFNTLVFDEIYYVKFADQYLSGKPFFDGHPPLSKYIIAVGIWVAESLHLGPQVGNDLAGGFHTTWSYRWTAALTGSFIPIVVAELVRQVSQNRRFALIAGSLVALDGLFLVESRYALNNVYLVIFGLLGQLGLVLAAKAISGSSRMELRQRFNLFGSRWQVRQRLSVSDWRSWITLQLQFWGWLSLAGVCFGASASIKWNGLWFLLGADGVWAIGWLYWLVERFNLRSRLAVALDRKASAVEPQPEPSQSLFWQLGQINPIAIALCLGILPALFYYWIWSPHLQLNPETNFWELQQQILTYHEQVKSGKAVHPYCSDWLSWLVMQQPIAYFYQLDIDPQRVLPTGAAIKPTGDIFAVHAMGNPILWWASTAAIGGLLIAAIDSLWQRGKTWWQGGDGLRPIMGSADLAIVSYLLINYAANLLPWIRVTRCIFLYHYMGSSIFSMIGLAWWCDRAWRDPVLRPWVAILGALIVLSFGFWLPVYLGLPLSSEAYQMRMWSKAWICGANCPS